MSGVSKHFDEYCLAFGLITGMGIDLANKILDVIPSERDFFNLPQRDLEVIAGRRHKMLDAGYRASVLENARRELDLISKKGIKYHYFRDSDFPNRLIHAHDAPVLLFSVGDCNLNASKIVSVVGTRHATHYGVDATNNLIDELSALFPDIIIVSGLAYGIDIAAHNAAIRNNIPTIGVLAHGLDVIYPAAHRSIASKMARGNGMLITEYPLNTKMHKSSFLARNRIVAALADCTVVVESATQGGALVTAALADSYNRDVLAFPGRASDEFSTGCNNLIKRNKANIITSAIDIVNVMQWDTHDRNRTIEPKLPIFNEYTPRERRVIDFLTEAGASHINLLAAHMELRVHEMTALLIDMEFKGYLHALPGGKYSL